MASGDHSQPSLLSCIDEADSGVDSFNFLTSSRGGYEPRGFLTNRFCFSNIDLGKMCRWAYSEQVNLRRLIY